VRIRTPMRARARVPTRTGQSGPSRSKTWPSQAQDLKNKLSTEEATSGGNATVQTAGLPEYSCSRERLPPLPSARTRPDRTARPRRTPVHARALASEPARWVSARTSHSRRTVAFRAFSSADRRCRSAVADRDCALMRLAMDRSGRWTRRCKCSSSCGRASAGFIAHPISARARARMMLRARARMMRGTAGRYRTSSCGAWRRSSRTT
jgi:hypothetical protein